MNLIRHICPLGILVFWAGILTSGAATVLPGLEYLNPPVKLQGSLVFYYTSNQVSLTAQICEFDLERKTLRVITECPNGIFLPSRDGMTFSVFNLGDFRRKSLGTYLFAYSQRLQLSRYITFKEPPELPLPVHDHVLLWFRNQKSLLDYDVQKDRLTSVKFPGTEVDVTHTVMGVFRNPEDTHSGIFDCFEAMGSARNGAYRLDVLTGEVQWVGRHAPGIHENRIVGNRYLFFEGTDNPRAGKRLVTSPLDSIATKSDDPKGKNVQVLRKFTYNLWHWYELYQVSPCKRYAVITRHLQSYRGSPDLYYIVDVTTGEKWELAKVVPRSEKAYVSPITWVEKAKE